MTITEPAVLTSSIASQTNVSCNGGNSGSATVTASGGTTAYSYAWAPSGGNAATAIGLTAGTYVCTVTDGNGCTSNASVTITEPTLLTSSITSQTNISCNGGNNGSATVTASGGTVAYSYAWAPSGGNAATASSLAAGSYTCTITDANGCTTTASCIITQPTALTSSVSSQTNILCNGGNNGSATVTASGGNPSYTYSWMPSGGNAATASSLTAGTYTCTITDANGCTTNPTVAITEPSAISGVPTTTPATCGSNNGSATMTASGGTPAYTYSWAPSGGNSATAANLAAGIYTCTITDAHGCSSSFTASVSNSGGPTVTVSSQTNPTCNGGNNGSATVNVTGGNGPYTYSWSPSGGNAATASGLTAGSYTCTVIDANNCTVFTNISLINPAPIVISLGNDTSICSPSTVSFCAPAGYSSYLWSTTSTSSCITAGTSGCYSVIATDANGCQGKDTICLTVNICTGISEATTTGFNLFPNPNDGHFTVTLGNNQAQSLMELYDSYGKLLDSRIIHENENIDLSEYARGMYFVRINGEMHKLIIQ